MAFVLPDVSLLRGGKNAVSCRFCGMQNKFGRLKPGENLYELIYTMQRNEVVNHGYMHK